MNPASKPTELPAIQQKLSLNAGANIKIAIAVSVNKKNF
jgi:hypothetical protein